MTYAHTPNTNYYVLFATWLSLTLNMSVDSGFTGRQVRKKRKQQQTILFDVNELLFAFAHSRIFYADIYVILGSTQKAFKSKQI